MRVLISTSDKTGLIEFLKPLLSLNLEIVSTGGTFDYLKKNNFPVVDVSSVTQFPEVLDGRVKTLHPFIHMGLLADKSNLQHLKQAHEHNVKLFDMVIGNLYPFEKTALNSESSFEDLIENIDIGGPSFLRASAKNYNSVIVVCSPLDYQWVQTKILENSISSQDRKKLAMKVFSLTAYYDSLIVNKLAQESDALEYLNLPLKLKQSLRYGENSHQKASWYINPLETPSLSDIKFLQGKELSYNNLLDLEAASQLVQQFEQPTCVAVKHNNPCGVSETESLFESAKKAIQSDPKSIFGGILAFNRTLDLKTSELFKDIFIECIIAPDFSPESLQFFSSKKNLRLLSLNSLNKVSKSSTQLKSISGGVLQQEGDSFTSENWTFLGSKPDNSIVSNLLFSEKLVASLKSNAIAITYKNQSIGVGMGQVNRVDAVQQALERMNIFCLENKINKDEVVLASDAFFPFADSIELISKHQIKWILQPGGSLQDQKVIQAAVEHNINMVLTHRRHFKH